MDSVIMCRESDLDQVRDLDNGRWKEAMIFTIPDAEDDAMVRSICDRAAFLGTELRKRLYSGSEGKVIKQLTLR
jgi:hypothetical protein